MSKETNAARRRRKNRRLSSSSFTTVNNESCEIKTIEDCQRIIFDIYPNAILIKIKTKNLDTDCKCAISLYGDICSYNGLTEGKTPFQSWKCAAELISILY